MKIMRSDRSSTVRRVRFVEPSTVWYALSRLSKSVLIVLVALFIQSCRTTKAGVQTVQQSEQSLTAKQQSVINVEVGGAVEPRLADTTGLTLPLSAIKALPDGAEYSSKKGSVRVTVGRRGADSIHVQADATPHPPEPSVKIHAEMGSQITALDSSNTASVAETQNQKEQKSGVLLPFLVLTIVAFGLGLLLIKREK